MAITATLGAVLTGIQIAKSVYECVQNGDDVKATMKKVASDASDDTKQFVSDTHEFFSSKAGDVKDFLAEKHDEMVSLFGGDDDDDDDSDDADNAELASDADDSDGDAAAVEKAAEDPEDADD